MNPIFKNKKWARFLLGGLLVAAGLLIVIISIVDLDKVSLWLSVVLAVALFIYGGCLVLSGFVELKEKKFDPSLIIGSIIISLGILLCVYHDILGGLIVLFMGALLVTFGAVELGQGIEAILRKKSVLLRVLFLMFGVLLATCGILVICYRNEPTVLQIIYIASGSVIALLGIFELVVGSMHSINTKKSEKQAKENNKKLENKKPSKEIENKNEVSKK